MLVTRSKTDAYCLKGVTMSQTVRWRFDELDCKLVCKGLGEGSACRPTRRGGGGSGGNLGKDPNRMHARA